MGGWFHWGARRFGRGGRGEGALHDPVGPHDLEARPGAPDRGRLMLRGVRPSCWARCWAGAPHTSPAFAIGVCDHGADAGPQGREPTREQPRCAAVAEASGPDPARHEKAARVDRDPALAPRHPLVAVEAPSAPLSRGLHGPAVHDRHGGLGAVAPSRPRGTLRRVMDPRPRALPPPAAEAPPHRAPGREARGQHPPSAVGSQPMHDRVRDRAQVHVTRTPTRPRRRAMRFERRPLGVGQLRGATASCHVQPPSKADHGAAVATDVFPHTL